MTRALGRVATPAIVATLVLWAMLLRPQSLGGSIAYIVIRGTSMLPTYETGDLVVARAGDGYAVGDVIAYEVPAGQIGAGHVVVHRIVGGDAVSGFLVRGDNNASVDPWTPRPSDIVGRPMLHLAMVGRLLDLFHQPAALAALAAAIAVSWVLAGMPSAPRPQPPSIRRRRSYSSSSISPRA